MKAAERQQRPLREQERRAAGAAALEARRAAMAAKLAAAREAKEGKRNAADEKRQASRPAGQRQCIGGLSAAARTAVALPLVVAAPQQVTDPGSTGASAARASTKAAVESTPVAASATTRASKGKTTCREAAVVRGRGEGGGRR